MLSLDCCFLKLAKAFSKIEQGTKGVDAERFLKYLRGEIKDPVVDRPIIDRLDDLNFER